MMMSISRFLHGLAWIQWICCICCIVFGTLGGDIVEGRVESLARHLELSNESGERLQIEWVHPLTGELVPYGVAEPSSDKHISLDTYVNHTFVVRTITLKKASMRSTVLTVGEQEEQNFVVKKDLVVDVVNDEQSRRISQRSLLSPTLPKPMPGSPSENSLPTDGGAFSFA